MVDPELRQRGQENQKRHEQLERLAILMPNPEQSDQSQHESDADEGLWPRPEFQRPLQFTLRPSPTGFSGGEASFDEALAFKEAEHEVEWLECRAETRGKSTLVFDLCAAVPP